MGIRKTEKKTNIIIWADFRSTGWERSERKESVGSREEKDARWPG